jgi:hypothetical protein
MKNGLSYLARGILLTGTLIAYGQTPSPTALAQSPPIRCSGNAAASARRRAVATELVKRGKRSGLLQRPRPARYALVSCICGRPDVAGRLREPCP